MPKNVHQQRDFRLAMACHINDTCTRATLSSGNQKTSFTEGVLLINLQAETAPFVH